MVDSIFSQQAPKPGMMARLKISTPPASAKGPADAPLKDLVQISSAAQARLSEGRKLDAYLRTFASVLKWLNGSGWGGHAGGGYKPVASKIEIEYVEMKNPYKVDREA